MYTKTHVIAILLIATGALQAKTPSIKRTSSQDIISMIAQGQMKTFEGELFKKNLDQTALNDWNNNVVTPLISYAKSNSSDPATLSALKQLDETLKFVTFTIEYLHKDYPRITNTQQHILALESELNTMLKMHNEAFNKLTQNLREQKKSQWPQTAPKLITHVLTSEQHAFFDNYRKASQDGKKSIDATLLTKILKESGIASTGNKYKDKPAILALLENLDRYAYLLTDYYKRLVTHRSEKAATARQAALQLRNTYGNTQAEDQAIAGSTDKPWVIIYRLSGTYAEVLQHLIRELSELS